MAESEVLLPVDSAVRDHLAEVVEAPPEGPPPQIAGRNRARDVTVGLGALVVGAVLVVVGTMVVQDASAVARVALTVAGLYAIYVGIDRFALRIFGDTFETSLWLSMSWFALVVLSAILANLLPLAEAKNVSKTILEPTLLRPDLFSEHPLGTDNQGLDILGGVIYGARVSLVVGFGAVLIGMTIGSLIGICAGYYRGRTDGAVSLLADCILAFPPLILLLGMVAVLEPNVRNIAVALAILTVPTYIRLSRANTMVFAQREFVLAARGLGATNRRLIFRELLPNVILPVVSYAFIIVGALIVAEASLSFLGLSISRPTPTWGNMVAAGQTDFEEHPHLVFVPGTVLFVTVFALNRIGDKARRLWDPRHSAM